MEGWTYHGPFDELPAQVEAGAPEAHRVILWDEVGQEEGTGIVHIAPGAGAEDYQLGKELGLPEELIWRQPFPGPGLAIRIIGEISRQRLLILRNVDDLLLDEIKAAGYYRKLWQSFAVLLPIKSVGVMGDRRTYENIVAIRAVTSKDAMTADWAKLPQKLLGKISNRIINEVSGVNRVVYDISSKPPSTIEWE